MIVILHKCFQNVKEEEILPTPSYAHFPNTKTRPVTRKKSNICHEHKCERLNNRLANEMRHKR